MSVSPFASENPRFLMEFDYFFFNRLDSDSIDWVLMRFHVWIAILMRSCLEILLISYFLRLIWVCLGKLIRFLVDYGVLMCFFLIFFTSLSDSTLSMIKALSFFLSFVLNRNLVADFVRCCSVLFLMTGFIFVLVSVIWLRSELDHASFVASFSLQFHWFYWAFGTFFCFVVIFFLPLRSIGWIVSECLISFLLLDSIFFVSDWFRISDEFCLDVLGSVI